MPKPNPYAEDDEDMTWPTAHTNGNRPYDCRPWPDQIADEVARLKEHIKKLEEDAAWRDQEIAELRALVGTLSSTILKVSHTLDTFIGAL